MDVLEEIKQAIWIAKERQEMVTAAECEGERIIAEAHERQTQLVVEHDLTGQVELGSEDIIDSARVEEREIRLGARLRRRDPQHLEINLSKIIAAIQPAANASAVRTNRPNSTNPRAIGPPYVLAQRALAQGPVNGPGQPVLRERSPHGLAQRQIRRSRPASGTVRQ